MKEYKPKGPLVIPRDVFDTGIEELIAGHPHLVEFVQRLLIDPFPPQSGEAGPNWHKVVFVLDKAIRGAGSSTLGPLEELKARFRQSL